MHCQKCGENLPDDSMFCGYCGATLENTSPNHAVQARQEEPHSAPKPKEKKRRKGV